MPQTNAEIMVAEPGVWVEVDGKLVPDYDAKIVSFDEGTSSRARWCASIATRSSSTWGTSRKA